MKISVDANETKRFGIKNFLIRLNQDLELIVERIDRKVYDSALYCHSHNLHLTNLSNIQLAVLFLEDRRFFFHRGFEVRAPFRIVKRLVQGKRAGAISTIDQQLVRIATGRYERKIGRKIRETILAYLLNFHKSKSEIFYAYIHDSYFGYQIEGCETAARFLFSKNAMDLSPNESCFIAALLARPLPRAVFEKIEKEKLFREITPDYVIKIGTLERLDWAKKARSRYQYACEMFPSIPNNLRTR